MAKNKRTKSDRRKDIWRKANGVCAHCGKDVIDEYRTIDHVIPQFYGGGDDQRNLMPLCEKCNRDRASGAIVPQTYYKFASKVSIRDLMDYIGEWKAGRTNAAGYVMTYDGRYGIDEAGMEKYEKESRQVKGGFYTAAIPSI